MKLTKISTLALALVLVLGAAPHPPASTEIVNEDTDEFGDSTLELRFPNYGRMHLSCDFSDNGMPRLWSFPRGETRSRIRLREYFRILISDNDGTYVALKVGSCYYGACDMTLMADEWHRLRNASRLAIRTNMKQTVVDISLTNADRENMKKFDRLCETN